MKFLTRKQIFAIASLIINILVMFGIVLPALVSATDTLLVVLGFLLTPVAIYAAYVSIVKLFETDEKKGTWGR